MPVVKNRLFYGWVVLLSLLIMGIAIWGVRYSFTIFFKDIGNEFSLNRAATSAIFSINILLGGFFAFLFGWALDRYGPRIVLFLMGIFTGLGMLLTSQTNSFWQLFLTYSLLLAMGGGAAFTVINSTLARWFDKKRGMVLGIGASGSGLGPMVMAPIATFLISAFGWRIAFAVMGGIAWVTVLPLSRLLKKDPREIGALPDGVKPDSTKAYVGNKETQADNILRTDYSLLLVVNTRSFWFFLFIWFFYAYNQCLILTHLVPHATDIGLSAVGASFVFSLLSVMAVIGRVLLGFLSDKVDRKLTAILCAFLQAIAMVWLIWARDIWMLYLFAIFWGLGYGGLTPCIAALISETFTLGRIGIIFGILDVGFSIGGAIGSVTGGLIFDISKSYFIAFLIAALVMFITILLIASIRREAAKAIFLHSR